MEAPVVQFVDAQLHFLDARGERALLTFRPGLSAPRAATLTWWSPAVTYDLQVIKHVRSITRRSRFGSRTVGFGTRILVKVVRANRAAEVPAAGGAALGG